MFRTINTENVLRYGHDHNHHRMNCFIWASLVHAHTAYVCWNGITRFQLNHTFFSIFVDINYETHPWIGISDFVAKYERVKHASHVMQWSMFFNVRRFIFFGIKNRCNKKLFYDKITVNQNWKWITGRLDSYKVYIVQSRILVAHT